MDGRPRLAVTLAGIAATATASIAHAAQAPDPCSDPMVSTALFAGPAATEAASPAAFSNALQAHLGPDWRVAPSRFADGQSALLVTPPGVTDKLALPQPVSSLDQLAEALLELSRQAEPGTPPLTATIDPSTSLARSLVPIRLRIGEPPPSPSTSPEQNHTVISKLLTAEPRDALALVLKHPALVRSARPAELRALQSRFFAAAPNEPCPLTRGWFRLLACMARPRLGTRYIEALRPVHLLDAAADAEACRAVREGFVPADWSAEWAVFMHQTDLVANAPRGEPFDVASKARFGELIVRILLAERSADVDDEILRRAMARYDTLAQSLRDRLAPGERDATKILAAAQFVVSPLIAIDLPEAGSTLAESLAAGRLTCLPLSLLIAALVDPYGVQTDVMSFTPSLAPVGHAALRVSSPEATFWWETTHFADDSTGTEPNRFEDLPPLIFALYPDERRPSPDGEPPELEVTLLPPAEFAAQSARQTALQLRPFLP